MNLWMGIAHKRVLRRDWTTREHELIEGLYPRLDIPVIEIAEIIGRPIESVKSYAKRNNLRRGRITKTRTCPCCQKIFHHETDHVCRRCKNSPEWTTMARAMA